MISTLLYSLLFYSLTATPASVHDYHVSKCQIKYSTENQALQITLHFFIDDMELALDTQTEEPLFLGTAREIPAAEQLLQNYLNEHLTFRIDGKKRPTTWIGRETSEDLTGIWCYLEIPNLPRPSKMLIHNDILLEVFGDQKNILSFNLDGAGEVYYMFRNGQSEQTIHIPD